VLVDLDRFPDLDAPRRIARHLARPMSKDVTFDRNERIRPAQPQAGQFAGESREEIENVFGGLWPSAIVHTWCGLVLQEPTAPFEVGAIWNDELGHSKKALAMPDGSLTACFETPSFPVMILQDQAYEIQDSAVGNS